MNINNALRCLVAQMRNGTYADAKVGLVKSTAPETLDHYKRDFILFRKSVYDESLVIEKPMSREWLAKQRDDGSLATTYCTMVGVPRQHITEMPLVHKFARTLVRT